MRARALHKKVKEERLNIRASARQKEIIARAADIEEKSISQFVLDHAVEAARQVLADQSHFPLSPPQWQAFCAALDAPPRAVPPLARLLTSGGVFDEH